jgi:SAM-dependent methyltransferase
VDRPRRNSGVATTRTRQSALIGRLGCGWGPARRATRRGGRRRVVGVDPAKAMLDIAREGEGHELVEWIWGDIHAARAGRRSGRDDRHIPSIYVTDEAWDEVLAGVHAALRPGGHLAFGGWNLEARHWEARARAPLCCRWAMAKASGLAASVEAWAWS